jgi:hypothetical protein
VDAEPVLLIECVVGFPKAAIPDAQAGGHIHDSLLGLGFVFEPPTSAIQIIRDGMLAAREAARQTRARQVEKRVFEAIT